MAQPVWAADTGPGEGWDVSQATGTVSQSAERGPVVSLGKKSGKQTYIIQLKDPAAPTRGTLAGKGASTQKLSEKAYVSQIVQEQGVLRSAIQRITKTAPDVKFSYTHAINGIAVSLTRDQALKTSQLDGIASIQVEKMSELQTDVGPDWVGAPAIWQGDSVPNGTGSKGEGIIVGVLDSGVNPQNPSFAATVSEADGGDGYVVQNPNGSGNYLGVCDPASADYIANWGCTDKLIGFYDYVEDGTDYDDDGHGTHTASTAAGNQLEVETFAEDGEFSWTGIIKGVAPHANVISFDVCGPDACGGAATIAALDQAIEDDVDAINYSIGSPSATGDPWADAESMAWLNARAAGIYVAMSAGNDGPGAETLGSPADIPWTTSVGATTHNRQWRAKVTDITADDATTLADINGLAFASPTAGSFPLVIGSAVGSATCERAPLAAVDLTGKIVICDRGGTAGRVEKGEIVKARGAVGMVLANNQANGTSLNADPHAVAAVHITYADGVALKAYVQAHAGAEAALSGGLRYTGDDAADIMAAFSSRGANRSVSLVGPSVSAPGVDVLAGTGVDGEVSWGFVSGTSMASPHTAGAYALIKSVHPDWTPAHAQSALMMTSETDILDNDLTPADWSDMGSGRIDLTKVAMAGLVQDIAPADYVAADPAAGGDVRTLNMASMADNECLASCSWTRTFTGTSTGVGAWTAEVEPISEGLTLSVDQPGFTIAEGEDVDLTVTAEVVDQPTDTWLYGTLVLTPPAGSDAPVAHLPIAVLPSNGVLPQSIDITTRRDAGSQATAGLKAKAIDALQISASGLVPEKLTEVSAPFDTTNDNPYDGNGVSVTQVTVPAGSTLLSAAIENATARDFDLYVGKGAVSAANELCVSGTSGSVELCEIADPEPGTYWVLVQNWQASALGATDTADLLTAVVGGDEGNLRATGPAGAVPAGQPFSIRTFWDEDAMAAGDTWRGSLTLGSGPGEADNLGVIPVTIERVADDVTKVADTDTAAPGDTVTYTVTVEPNVSQEDVTYSITDTIPDGMTYVPGSATGGATVAGNTVSWSKEMVSSFGKEGDYTITTSADDDSCVNPYTGTAEYLDAKTQFNFSTQAGVSGDTKLFSYFTNMKVGMYDGLYSGINMTDDGFLVFDPTLPYGADSEPYYNQTVPDVTEPNNLAAGLWQDMVLDYDAAANKGATAVTFSSGGVPVVGLLELDDLRLYEDPASTYDMEVWAFADSSDLVFVYDNINGPLTDVTIGTENSTGTKGSALVNSGDATGVIANDTVVCMTYQSAVGPAEEFTYQVTVDADTHDRQVLTNNAVHTTSDPGAKPATTTATVTVGDASERTETALSLDPNPVVTGGTTTATATVFSAGEAEATGTVEFLIGGTVAGTGTLDATGKATAALTAPATEGVYQVTARYLGDADNLPSTSAPSNLAVTKPATPPTTGPSPSPTPTPTPTPSPVVKVKTQIVLKTPKQVKVRSGRGKVTFVVTAEDITPSGAVKVQIKGAGKNKTVTVLLDEAGKGKVSLPTYKKTGRVKVTVSYGGDVVSLSSSEVKRFRVVD